MFEAEGSSKEVAGRLSFLQAQLLLHLTVLVWGLTAILGKLITLPALCLVFYRQVLASLGILVIAGWDQLRVDRSKVAPLMLGGVIIALHWSLFFASVHSNGVAISVICLSAGSLVTSLCEPWMMCKRWDPWDSVGGLLAVIGVVLVVGTTGGQDGLAPVSSTGLLLGLGSAFFGGLFSAHNGRYVPHYSDYQISFWQLVWGSAAIGTVVLFLPHQWAAPWNFGWLNWCCLLVLAFLCTTLPWIWSAKILRTLNPFTMQLAVNLEPVYSMLIAYLWFPKTERLPSTFYCGSAGILGLIFAHQWWTRRRVSPQLLS